MFSAILCCALWVFEEWGCCHFWTADLHWVSLFQSKHPQFSEFLYPRLLSIPLTPWRELSSFLYPLGGVQNWIHNLHSRATSEEDGGNAQLPSFAYWCIDGMSKVTPACSGSWVTLWPLANIHLVSVSQQKFLHASIIRHLSWARERVRDLIYEESLEQILFMKNVYNNFPFYLHWMSLSTLWCLPEAS